MFCETSVKISTNSYALRKPALKLLKLSEEFVQIIPSGIDIHTFNMLFELYFIKFNGSTLKSVKRRIASIISNHWPLHSHTLVWHYWNEFLNNCATLFTNDINAIMEVHGLNVIVSCYFGLEWFTLLSLLYFGIYLFDCSKVLISETSKHTRIVTAHVVHNAGYLKGEFNLYITCLARLSQFHFGGTISNKKGKTSGRVINYLYWSQKDIFCLYTYSFMEDINNIAYH
jgi:hypothetical protein